MLEIKNLAVQVLDKPILNEFTLTIPSGEIHVLMGPNGVGKSTICKVIMNSPGYKVTSGDIKYNCENITNLDPSEISKKGIFYLSQNPIAIEGVTNAEMLRMALTARTGQKIDIFSFNKKCNEICTKINLPKTFLHRSVNDGMSGGERKKNELLHLWMLEPSFIILDEVDSGLDVDALKTVSESILEYYKEKKPSILIITHQNKILETLVPNQIHILKEGKIIKSGDKSLAEMIENSGFSGLYESKQLSEEENCE